MREEATTTVRNKEKRATAQEKNTTVGDNTITSSIVAEFTALDPNDATVSDSKVSEVFQKIFQLYRRQI